VLSFALEVAGISDTRVAEDCAVAAVVVGAIHNLRGRSTAYITVANYDGVFIVKLTVMRSSNTYSEPSQRPLSR